MNEYKGQKYSFTVKEEKYLGKGGNGCVYKINNLTPKIDDEDIKFYAVKFFKYKKSEIEYKESSSNKKYSQRYNRFKKEIRKLKELKGIEGIVEIIDYSLPDELPSEYKKAWFLMPGLNNFPKPGTIDLTQIIEYMLQLGKILKRLHEQDEKIAHRDIKPSNLLLKKNKVYLADFGLIWIEKEEGFTLDEERLGPRDIMPPEFKKMNHSINIPLDYTKSDVYLFSKVLWIYLKNNEHGFPGEYDRTKEKYYINPNSLNIITLGPIQDLIEQSTFDLMDNRIDINQCIEKLELQKKIMNNQVPKEKLNQIIYNEIVLSYFDLNKKFESIFSTPHEIIKILEKINSVTLFTIKSVRSNNSIIQAVEYKIKKLKNDLFQIIINLNNKKVIFEFNIEQLLYKKSEKKIMAKLRYINTKEAKLEEFSEEKYNEILYGDRIENFQIDNNFTFGINKTYSYSYIIQENFELLFNCK